MDNNEENKKLSFAGIRDVIKYSVRLTKIMWPGNWKLMLSQAGVVLLISLNPFIQAGTLGLLINEITRSASIGAFSDHLIIVLGIFAAGALFISFMMPFQDYFSRLFISRITEQMDFVFLKKLTEIDFAAREDSKNTNLFNNARENTWRIRDFLGRQYFMFQNLIEVAVATVVLLIYSPVVFLILLGGSIPELISEIKYGQEVWGIWTAKAEIRRKYWNVKSSFEQRNYLFDMKLFQNAAYFLAQIRDILARFANDEIKNEKKKLFRFISTRMLAQAAILICIFLFVNGVVHGTLLVGTLVFMISSLFNLRQSLSGFFQNLGRQYQDSLFIGDLFKLLDMKPALSRGESGAVLSSAETPEIVFENVTFQYPTGESPILKDFSLHIKPGDKTAIIGINGVGKTTFVKLLLRFYDPTEGRILVNGHDLKSLDIESWYSLIGVLFQDYATYHLLVKDAIALGRTSKATDLEKVKESAKAAEADTFITEWEKNYDQQLGSWLGGIEPSIGQWQKLALARTFYRDPKILILDEPTSSIDAEAEAKIFEKLEALPKDKTVILISHRFSTVRQADQIVVIEDGKIKEHGRHDDLLAKKGTYAKLFNLQAKGYK